ncbi:diguanylate cyclase (GGDEF)-like protein [Nitrosomonas oligotropha]|uniref:diguanylate cyclase n=1 Tax=Nitrosomonas oligotropha TaxID=42354 RepID=A0A2T5HDZ3_9PROT|nr:diguanylate cyclase [Nitrosomonas oligotropha]PTQ69789.1 diguanylate cyclase (GGDEF)-like protein [Nitrosomonas oligotropha]
MKKLFVLLIMMLMSVFWCLTASAAINVAEEYKETIGQHIRVYQGEDTHWRMQDALVAYRDGRFSQSGSSVINFGIGAKPVWLAFSVKNDGHNAVHRNLLLETSWLDKVDIYFLRQDELTGSHHTGDSLLFSQRPLNHRFFVAGHDFGAGETTVLIRVESDDDMVLPLYFISNEALADRDLWQAYSYGFMYGVILALVAYNVMLYVGLRTGPYLFYSLYLLFFLLLNAAYTGHGYQWLWPESPQWQKWANPVLIMACTVSGFAFALQFLNIKTAWPRVYRFVIASSAVFCALMLLAMLAGEFVVSLLMSLVFIFFFYISSIVLGVISLQAGNQFAKYFLLASIFTICGGAITANAVWGFIPFTEWTYRATDIGMMMDAILLALALAERFNINQNEKLLAEKMAGIDSLTNLNNRRSFYKYVQPIWAMGLRSKNSTSVIMLDIDNFKLLNDTYGHALGDRVLVQLAETLQKEARSGDILTRWGGEEFLIFLPETRLADAIAIAERMRNKVNAIQLTSIKGEKLLFTASFGVAHTLVTNVSLDELISQADQQLYRAKKQGRNCVCSDQSD